MIPRCLNEYNFQCRSATYDVSLRSCTMSRFTRRTHPDLLEDSPNSEYLENTCLNGWYTFPPSLSSNIKKIFSPQPSIVATVSRYL